MKQRRTKTMLLFSTFNGIFSQFFSYPNTYGLPLIRRFFRGAIWSVLGSALSNGLTVILLIFVARLLGKEAYGQFVAIQSTVSTVSVFAGLGIGSTATRYTAELRTKDAKRLGHILALAEILALGGGLLATVALTATAGLLAAFALNAPSLRLPIVFASASVFFTVIDGYQKGILIGFEAMQALAIGNIISVTLSLPVLLFTASHFGLNGAAAAITANALIQAGITRYQLKCELNKFNVTPSFRGSTKELPVIWNFALPALLSGLLVGPVHWAAQAMLAQTTNGFAELAVFGTAMQWLNGIIFIPSTAGRIVLPMLTDQITKCDLSNSRKILLYAMSANAIVAVPFAAVVAVFSPNIMRFYGNDFAFDFISLRVAAFTAVLIAIQAPVGSLVAATSRMWLGALMNAAWATIYLCSACFFLEMGALGVLVALALAYLGQALWTFWFAFRQTST